MAKLSTVASLLLSPLLLFGTQAQTDTEVFMKKYIEKDSKAYQSGKVLYDESKRAKISENVSLDKIGIRDINNTSYKIDLSSNKNKHQAKEIADRINRDARSQEFQSKVDANKQHILYDKQLGFQNKMGSYANLANSIVDRKYKDVPYSNEYLNHNERIIIAISSSVPKETIKNYFDSLSEVPQDISFVMNGFIGNDIKYALPTINYIKELLEKRNVSSKKNIEDRYLFKIDINPKIFMKYNLTNVPAVIYIKNYNPYDEIQGNTYTGKETDKEEVWIAYGDSNVEYVLEKINKEAKSKGLAKLLKNINKGFFK